MSKTRKKKTAKMRTPDEPKPACPMCDDDATERLVRSPSGWWYLSFGDPDTGEWLGGCIVEGETMIDAARRAWDLEINPGGELLGFPLSAESVGRLPHDRLLRREDLGPAVHVKTRGRLLH